MYEYIITNTKPPINIQYTPETDKLSVLNANTNYEYTKDRVNITVNEERKQLERNTLKTRIRSISESRVQTDKEKLLYDTQQNTIIINYN